MMRGAEEHGLVLQRHARLAVLEHLLDDVARLVGLVGDGDEERPAAAVALRPEVLGVALGREPDDRVRGGEDRLGRAVVAGERDDARADGENSPGKSRMLRTVAARKE